MNKYMRTFIALSALLWALVFLGVAVNAFTVTTQDCIDYPGECLLYDDGSDVSKLRQQTGFVTLTNNIFTATNNSDEMIYDWTDSTGEAGVISIEMNLMVEDCSAFTDSIYSNDDADSNVNAHIFLRPGNTANKWSFRNSGGTFDDYGTCSDATWYEMKLEQNLSSDTFDFYLDGVLTGDNSDARSDQAELDRFGFYLSTANYIKWANVTVYNGVNITRDNPTPQIQTNITSGGIYNSENLTGSATTSRDVNMTFFQNGIQIGELNETNSTSYTISNLNLGLNNISLRSININGTNWNNFSITYQPFQYFYFNDSNDNPIYNFSLDGTNYEFFANVPANSLNYGTNSLVFSKIGYASSNINFNLTQLSQLNNSYSASEARIVLNVLDQETGNALTGINFSVEFIATVGLLTSTTTGIVNVTNTLFQNEGYMAVVSNTDYQTETINFNFNNQQELELDVYMIETNNTNLGKVFIEPVSSFGQNLVGITVKALQWDSSSSSYIQVSQAVTGSDGLGTLNVILDDKVYIFTATADGISANSTSEIIDSTENGKTITIILSGVSAEFDYLLEGVTSSVTESFNQTTNISTMTLTWDNSDGTNVNACLNSYRLISTSETQLTENCTSAAAGTKIINFYINSSYTTILKGEFKLDSGALTTIKSFRHFPANSLPSILADLGLNIVVVPILFLGALAIGMLLQNVYIGSMLIFIFGGFSLYLAPTILTSGIVAFLGFVTFMTLFYGVKPR